MSAPFKPEGYNTVSPYLIVDGASGTLAFLTTVFNAVELKRYMSEDGKRIGHAEMRIGDSVLMVGDGFEGWPPISSHVHIFVADVDDTYRRALEAGATSIQEPTQNEDQAKRGGVKDAGGVTWWISQQMA